MRQEQCDPRLAANGSRHLEPLADARESGLPGAALKRPTHFCCSCRQVKLTIPRVWPALLWSAVVWPARVWVVYVSGWSRRLVLHRLPGFVESVTCPQIGGIP